MFKKQLNEEALKALTAICYFLKIKTGYNINRLSNVTLLIIEFEQLLVTTF